MNIPELIQQVTDKIEKFAHVKVCFGEPVKINQQTIIPVASIRIGGGGGGCMGKGIQPTEQVEGTEGSEAEEQTACKGTGGGGGFGMQVKPVGYIEEVDGAVRFRPILDGKMIAILGLGSLFGLGLILKILFKRSED
jgi:uncharacterized spore protein YtfJ